MHNLCIVHRSIANSKELLFKSDQPRYCKHAMRTWTQEWSHSTHSKTTETSGHKSANACRSGGQANTGGGPSWFANQFTPVTMMQHISVFPGHSHPRHAGLHLDLYQSAGLLPMDLHILTCSVSLRATLPRVSVSTTGTPTSSLQLTCASSTSSLCRAHTHNSQSLPTYTITAGQVVCGYNALTLCQHSWMYLMRYRSNCPHVTRLIWAKHVDCTSLAHLKAIKTCNIIYHQFVLCSNSFGCLSPDSRSYIMSHCMVKS